MLTHTHTYIYIRDICSEELTPKPKLFVKLLRWSRAVGGRLAADLDTLHLGQGEDANDSSETSCCQDWLIGDRIEGPGTAIEVLICLTSLSRKLSVNNLHWYIYIQAVEVFYGMWTVGTSSNTHTHKNPVITNMKAETVLKHESWKFWLTKCTHSESDPNVDKTHTYIDRSDRFRIQYPIVRLQNTYSHSFQWLFTNSDTQSTSWQTNTTCNS